MKAWTVIGFAALALGLAMTVQCGRQSALPVAASETAPPGVGEQLPFDRQAQGQGISPSSAVIPPGARIPAGTPINIHLRAPLVSTTARSGDTFQALLIDPIIVNGQTVAERGASVTGRVMEAKAGQLASPGYIRLALNSIAINGKPSAVQSSSNFLKGKPAAANKTVAGTNQAPSAMGGRDVTVATDRRLAFHLTEPIPLHD